MPRNTSRRSRKSSRLRAHPHPHKIKPSDGASDRLLDQVTTALSDAELLSLFLKTEAASPPLRESERLLGKFGSLRNLLSADWRGASNARMS